MELTFLGTASAMPSSTRSHSSLALRIGSDVWLFDCGEGTQRQLQRSVVKMGKISKIFVTHLHGDHVFGIVPLMAGLLNGAGGVTDGEEDPRQVVDVDNPVLEIYGPLGTRAYVRSNLFHTYTMLGNAYVVHELRMPEDPKTGDFTNLRRHYSESPSGRNIPQIDGVWRDIFSEGSISVSAGPILHSVPCVGYVVEEPSLPGKVDPQMYLPEIKRTNTPVSVMRAIQQGKSVQLADGTVLHGPARRRGRKLVILGDTYDPSLIEPLALDPDLLIHEATNAHLPGVDHRTKDTETYDLIEERTKSRGHSTPQMAGAFAKRIRAKTLILNHFSTKYAGDDHIDPAARAIMDTIRGLAAAVSGGEVICARDLMSYTVEVPPT
ncbi:beta-lactamase-like protein [Mycena amicta]|nr:beta-lactamase-like protein [Mycena amicta]